MKLILNVMSTPLLIATMGLSTHVTAQSNAQYSADPDAYVTVYEDCKFRGTSRLVPVGDYVNMRSFDFGNDAMSSVRVPPGLELTIYQDDKFRGSYARIDRDIYCFDKRWNDEVSSIRVSEVGGPSTSDDSGYGVPRSNRPHRGNASRDDRSFNDRVQNRPGDDSNVTAANVAMVVFKGRVLRKTNKRQWQIVDGQYGVSQYKEVSRDSNSVLLQNEYTSEQVRIDLYDNEVTLTNRKGQRNSFPITHKSADKSLAGKPKPLKPVIRGQCFKYRAYTQGGNGGIRFHGHEGFYQFNKSAHKGRICHKGPLTMEINKQEPSTKVIVEIQGQKYRFAPNETPTAFKNTWFRKHVKLNVVPN